MLSRERVEIPRLGPKHPPSQGGFDRGTLLSESPKEAGATRLPADGATPSPLRARALAVDLARPFLLTWGCSAEDACSARADAAVCALRR
jgi:hypothetical protein